MYKEARKKAGISMEEAAFDLHIGVRTLAKYEAGETLPPPDVVLGMSNLYGVPWLTQQYCRTNCAIGEAYSYEVLDNVCIEPASVLLKLVGEMAEAQSVLQRMLELAVNKRCREDFTDEHWAEFMVCVHEFLDVEHVAETLKISLGRWIDVTGVVQEHNEKCRTRGYVKKTKKKPA